VSKLGPAIMDLTAIHGYRLWGGNADPDGVAFDGNDGQADVAVDDDFLTNSSCENKHGNSSMKG
jgi:hypothetical protein